MAWVIYLGIQELHPGSESWLAEWGRVLSLSNAMSALEEGETTNLVTLLPQGETEAYESLSLWLRQHPETRCTLVYPQAGLAIGRELQQGAELEGACQQWKQQAQALLSLFRQHRRQISLLSWPAAAHTPEDAAPDQVPLPEYSTNPEIEPIYTLLAHQALAQDAALAEAARYLAASTHNATRGQLAGPSLSAILERHRQDQQQQRQAQQTHAEALQTLREERAQASQHSDELQQSLDRLKKQTDEKRERLEDLQARHDQAQAASQAQEEENALLLQQLHGVQEELEQALLNRRGLEEQLHKAKSAQGDLEQRFKQTQEEFKTEQANSAGLKQQRDKLHAERDKLNAQRKESEEENALLLEQLHFVQEELERHILEHRDQERRYTEQQSALTEQNNALQHQLTELQQAHQQQELLVQWLQAFATRTSRALYKKHRTMLKEHKALLASSASFDADWYARTYPDVVESGIEPAIHYLKYGMLEGRNPSAEFDTRHYITAHPDITAAGEHPLLHYIRWGRDEQRQAMPQPLAEESR